MNMLTLLTVSATMACMALPASALNSSRRTISYHTVEIQGLKIFYREAGPADAPIVLLLHGFPSSSRMWEPLLRSDRVASCHASYNATTTGDTHVRQYQP